MSGGFFEYKQYHINDIVDELQHVIDNNNVPDTYGYARNFSEKTLQEFEKAKVILKKASIYAQRIDWLISGDDSEESFHERLKEELDKLDTNDSWCDLDDSTPRDGTEILLKIPLSWEQPNKSDSRIGSGHIIGSYWFDNGVWKNRIDQFVQEKEGMQWKKIK